MTYRASSAPTVRRIYLRRPSKKRTLLALFTIAYESYDNHCTKRKKTIINTCLLYACDVVIISCPIIDGCARGVRSYYTYNNIYVLIRCKLFGVILLRYASRNVRRRRRRRCRVRRSDVSVAVEMRNSESNRTTPVSW